MMVIFYNLEYGIGELNMALLCTDWKNKAKIEEKQEKIANKEIEKSDNKETEIPFQKFDDEDFEKVLSQMMEIRNMNMNKNLDDEERRKNAENAILLLSKYLNLDEGELDENDD